MSTHDCIFGTWKLVFPNKQRNNAVNSPNTGARIVHQSAFLLMLLVVML